jgi:hypothetical protein
MYAARQGRELPLVRHVSKRVPIQFPGSGRKSLVKTTLQRGGFTAELYLDRKSSPPIYHYVVTRKDSAEIIAWGQVLSKAEAEAQALETMDELAKGLRRSASTG